MSSVVVPLNPFSDQIVTSPRRAEPSVQGLNDQALQKLVGAFTAMELPPRRGGRIHLVTSPSGGYGKSHLTGRLYRELGRRATQIYVRPFSDPDTHWVSLLHTIIQEMLAPEFTGEDEEEIKDRGVMPPTQLDAFVHGVFASVLISLLDSGEFEYGDPEFVRDRLRNRTFVKWDLGDPQSNWGLWASDMLQRYEESESRESRVLKSLNQATGNHLGSTTRPQAWLRVMRRFAANRGATALRDQCLEWMRARTPMIELVTKPLGLLATDGVDSEGGIAARNSMARSRVLDLLTLARLFRPFVICFDQTEVFGRVPGLARAFGGMLTDLVQCEGAQFTVVTANQEVWNTQLFPSIEVADRDRILPGIELTGLSQMQGRELALNRLRQTRLPVELQDLVLSPDWVAYQFGSGLLSPRDFLRRCEQRYEEIVPAALAQPPRPKLMLGELFAQERHQIESDPRESKDFRADALRWALLTVPDKAGADFKASPCRTDVASYTALWKGKSGSQRYIVLEPSSHTLVWQAIYRKGAALRTENPDSSVVALRIEGQGSVPHDNQAAHVQSNKASGKEIFRVYTLNTGDLSKVYAGWELYLQACQGDIPYTAEQVLAYVFDRLVPVYTAMLGEPVASTLPPELGTGVTTAALQSADAPTVIMPRSAMPAPAAAPAAQPAAVPAYAPPSFLSPGAGSLAAAVGTPSPAPGVAAPTSALKSPEETAPIHKSAIKITARVDGMMQSPPPAPAPMTFPPPSGLKPVEPMAPQPPLVTAPAPSPAVPSAPAPSPGIVTAPAAAAPAPANQAPVAAQAPPAPISPDTDRIVIASVTDILGAPAVRPEAVHAPLPAPAPAPLPAPAAPLPPPAPAPAPQPAPVQSFAQFIPPPTGFSAPPKPAPPQGTEAAQGTVVPKPGQKAFPAGSPAAGSSPEASSASSAAPAASTPARPAVPAPSRPGGEAPQAAGAVPPPNAGAPSKPAPPPAIAAKPVAPASVSKQSPVAAPAVGAPKPGVPGRPTGPTPSGAGTPAPRPAAPGTPTARGPMPAQPGVGPRTAPSPTAPSAAPSPPAEEKAGFFGRIGKMFKKETTAPAAAPATPRRPMPAATAARLAGAVPPGAPPGPQAPGAPAPASRRTEPVSVIPVSDDDSPEAAIRPAEVPPKKSVTEASPAKDASVENKTSATGSPENSQANAAMGDAKAEPVVSVEQTKTPEPGQAGGASKSAPAPVAATPSAAPAPPQAGAATVTPERMAKPAPVVVADPPFVATPASVRQHPSQPWTFSNEAMTRLAELLHPKKGEPSGDKANGHGRAHGPGHTNGKTQALVQGNSHRDEEEPLSQSPSHEAMVWLATCLREYHQERDAPEGNRRVAVFAKEEAPVAMPLIPAAVLSEVAGPASFEKVMRDLVKARRLISYPMLAMELEKRLSRSVSMEEANAAARASGDIHVYGEGDSAGYLWQGR